MVFKHPSIPKATKVFFSEDLKKSYYGEVSILFRMDMLRTGFLWSGVKKLCCLILCVAKIYKLQRLNKSLFISHGLLNLFKPIKFIYIVAGSLIFI